MQKDTTQKSDVALREEAIQAFWEEHDIFRKTLETPAGQKPIGDFVFYDGPPFATGLPHYGHILAGTIKDAVPRFWTMQGYRVRRKWGWDCHGLPLENLIEKKLGLATKRDIEEYGVQNFNEAAREAVLEYADDWRRIIPRMGRFVDMDDDYKTMDSSYTESVWWVFSELNKKGLVYEGFKGMHLCPRCGTTLSNFEVNQGYKDIKDIAVTVKLPLLDDAGTPSDTSLLVWTTTPWTLPGNMAAAVHKDYVYVKVKVTKETGEDLLILAKERLTQLDDVEYTVLEEIQGSDLVGKKYEPPFPYWNDQEFENKENAWTIYHADYVELGAEGTGAVHLAPAYGEEDMVQAKEYGIPIVHHVDEGGHFMSHITDFAGQLVKPKDDDDAEVTHLDADIEIVRALSASDKLFRKENITHSYPHCWRCDTPLLNYATTSWFVDVPSIKDKLVSENSKVHWVPDHVGHARFGKWLEGAREWAVSRQRYWGAPLPIWRNPKTEDVKIFGSLSDLQDYAPKSNNTYIALRHGEAPSNVDYEIRTDFSYEEHLTDNGRAQVAASAEKLRKENIDFIYVSPFIRTRETAEIVRETLGLAESQVIEDERLQEIQLSAPLQGKQWTEYAKLFANFEAEYTTHPEGIIENKADMQRRAGELLFEIDQKYEGKKILFIGHKASLFGLLSAARGLHVDEASEFKKEYWPENAEMRAFDFEPYPHNDNYVLDYHRPYIDTFQVFDTDGTKLERIPDVFDCWFESGSMPYAETHYPFENLDIANPAEGMRYPAHFISEAVDQTRGWFYSLMVLGVALFDKAPYENVITNGLVLAEDGKKMSKSLQNYPDPMYIADTIGVDSMRYYMLSSPIIKGEDLNFSEKGVLELQRKNIGRLHNVLAMYKEYAEDGVESRSDSTHVLDQWIVSRTNQIIADATEGYKSYELDKATKPITDFIDDLSIWYLRRSRDRLKSDDQADKMAALQTLRYVFQNLALVMAPPMPFYAEYLWQEVKNTDDAESVHLAAWPAGGDIDTNVLVAMKKTRELVTLALEARAKSGVKTRQPLGALTIKENGDGLSEDFRELIRDEVNVKTIVFDTGLEKEVELNTDITPELQAEGDAREFMRTVQSMRKTTGLSPKDRIILTVQTSDGGEAVVKSFLEEIVKTIGADDIVFGDAEGTEVKAGDHSFTVEMKKV